MGIEKKVSEQLQDIIELMEKHNIQELSTGGIFVKRDIANKKNRIESETETSED